MLFRFMTLLFLVTSSVSCVNAQAAFDEKQAIYDFYFANESSLLLSNNTEDDNPFVVQTDVIFKLYTRSNPLVPQLITNGNLSTLATSNFNKLLPIKVIIHGWNSDCTSKLNIDGRDAFLKMVDVNVICVDWSKGAYVFYTKAINNVPLVGKHVAQFVDWIVAQGSNINNFHFLGHSLGAHVSGIAARNLKSGKLPTLTGFDPAGPFWGPLSARIRKTDANYVEIIHSNAGVTGLKDPVGHNDFYPNGGTIQPGCNFDLLCPHQRSYFYYASSIVNDRFTAVRCNNVFEAELGLCFSTTKLNMGGLQTSKPKLGIFYLKTTDKAPFYLS